MELLEQCKIWNENSEYQKIIDALEAIPAEQRTPEMDSELARAYNNKAGPEDKELFRKAIALLQPHADYFKGDHCWNFRMAYAYYYLDQEGPALRYFEQALEARPGDEDTQELIDDCRRRLTLPRFEKPFRARVREAWAAFEQIEGELRAIMDADQTRERGEEIVAKCEGALNLALNSVAFEIGFNGEKYELILSADGIRHNLFPLVYFRAHAPKPVLEHWNIWVGRQPSADFSLRSGEDEVRPEDVQVWAERQENGQVALAVYCEKLLPLQREDVERAWWLLSTLTDHVLGEVNAIAHIGAFDLLDAPKKGPVPIPAVSLAELPQTLKNLGLTDYRDGADYLENCYLSYELEPNEDPDADWRADVFAGSTRLPALINDYMKAESGAVDAFLYAAIALSAVAAIVLSEGPARYAYASFPAVYVLMLALYYAGVVRGGADAKAVIAVAASMPAYCPLSDAISLPAEPAVFMFPPAIAVLVLAAVMVMLLAPCFLIRNLVRGDWAFPQMLMGYRRSLPEDGAHLWSLDRAEDGKVVPGTSPWDDDDAFRRLRDAGADRAWVTPMVPFVLPIAAAFAIVWVWGNPLFLLI